MPFDLTNAPSTFQTLMHEVLCPYLRKFVLVFFDDILIYNRAREEHCTHVEQEFQYLRKHTLVVNGSKCEFGVNRVAYLGHIKSAAGVSVDGDKISAMVS